MNPIEDECSHDLTGRRISHITVLRYMTGVDNWDRRVLQCECVCDCGQHVRRTVSQLRYANKHGYSSCCSNRCILRSRHVDTPSLDEQHMIAKHGVGVDLGDFDAYIAACRAGTLVPEDTI